VAPPSRDKLQASRHKLEGGNEHDTSEDITVDLRQKTDGDLGQFGRRFWICSGRGGGSVQPRVAARKWYYNGIWVNYQADGAGQSTGQDIISIAFNSTNGKVTVKGTHKKVDQNGQTEVKQDEGTGTYTVSQSCIATLTFPGDGNEPDDVVKLRVFPKKGIFVTLDQNEQPDEIALGFGLKAE